MKPSRIALGLGLGVFLVFGLVSRGADLPKAVDSAPCQAAPTIDGVIGPGEWRGASAFTLDLGMIRLDPASTETRRGELRVMNSANALYVAFRVADETADDSLAPPVLDLAMLAFARGGRVQAGDDRKVIAAGLYRDKHVGAPGKDDADDPRQDGRGAMSRDNGMVSFEWASPLGAGDEHDLRARPGDTVRFNLTYIDAFQVPLTKARLGGVYGPRLDRAEGWGTIRLAADAKDDGGAAFRGPAWVEPLFAGIRGGPAARLRLAESASVNGTNPPAGKVLVSFPYRDEHGKEREARAKLYLPDAAKPGAGAGAKVPLFFNAGYELPDGAEQEYLKRGWAVASPRELPTNPLIRTANPDIALLHMARALPFVDDARVVIGGGSAGGYMTLMLAAETFPLAGAAPDVPPVNWGYNAAYFFKQREKAGGDPKVPVMHAVATHLEGARDVYGGEYDDTTWFAHSPIAHVPTITCPVSVSWTTADVLVPMNQIGRRWVQPFEKSQFPEGFTMDPETLLKGREGRLTLMDVLPEGDYEVFTLDVPKGSTGARALPVSADKPWSIAIFDEGPPEPNVGHWKSPVAPTRDAFLKRMTADGRIAARQLTRAKLERLMDRYAGKEWLPSRLEHLDVAESERSDVLRGLSTYVASGPENARTFAELYAQLPPARKVLEPEVVKDLGAGQAPR